MADFGLARRLGAEQLGITVTGDLLGTPNYMAPEQVNGRHALVGPLTDVYALGAVLYAMLVGQPPFQSESVSETLYKICSVDPVRPRQIRRGVPRDLETICLKCLEKSPASRYQSAGELADDLRRFLAGEPLLAQTHLAIERGRRWFVRNPVVGTLAVGIALARVAGTAFSLHYARQAGQREQHARQSLCRGHEPRAAARAIRRGCQCAAPARTPSTGVWPKKFPSSVLRGGVRGRGPAIGANEAGWEWRHLWHQCHAELRRFEGPQDAMYAAAFSPDGQTVAATGADRLRVAVGNSHRKSNASLRVTLPRFATSLSPGWKATWPRSATTASLVWDIWDRLGDAVEVESQPFTGHERPLTAVAFSADGRLLATGGNEESKVNLWDTNHLRPAAVARLGPRREPRVCTPCAADWRLQAAMAAFAYVSLITIMSRGHTLRRFERTPMWSTTWLGPPTARAWRRLVRTAARASNCGTPIQRPANWCPRSAH